MRGNNVDFNKRTIYSNDTKLTKTNVLVVESLIEIQFN